MMQQITKIDSKENKLIKKVIRLASSSKFRNESGLAIIYGEHLVIEAIKNNLLEALFVEDISVDKHQSIIKKVNKSYSISSSLLKKITLLDNPANIVGIIKLHKSKMIRNNTEDYILLESIQDPGNLGTILRIANLAGINNVYLSKNSVDVYNPKVIRASQGMQFGLNINTNVDLVDFISHFTGNVVATTPNCKTTIYNLDLKQRTAFIFGNEGAGLSQPIINCTQQKACIPMVKYAESLNIAISVAVCAFEMVRQRTCY